MAVFPAFAPSLAEESSDLGNDAECDKLREAGSQETVRSEDPCIVRTLAGFCFVDFLRVFSCVALCLFADQCLFSNLVHAQQNPEGRLPITQYSEPYLLLLRDPVVQQELKLTKQQLQSLQEWNAETDAPLWTTRNQTPERGLEIARELIELSRKKMLTLLTGQQRQRLDQIELWIQGLKSLQRQKVIEELRLTVKQQQQIQEVLQETQQETQELAKQAQGGAPIGPLEKRNAELTQETQKKIQSLLKRDQLNSWAKMMGASLPMDKLGYVSFRAPALRGTGPWINSPPLTFADLRGKVVVVHFWTFGCSNCIHNYPAYHHWMEQFAGQDVVLLGIHTPELANEHDVAVIQQRAAENGLKYPILVDNESLNWNAWGNSMWPTVYLVDKQGNVRGWWQGELNWQGQKGEEIFKGRIEDLLAEDLPTVSQSPR